MLCNEGASFHFSKGNSYFDYKGHQHRLIERDGLYVLRLDKGLPAEDLAWLRQCEQSFSNCRDAEEQSTFGTSGGPYKHDRTCTCPTCLSINNAKRHIGDVRLYATMISRKGQLLCTDICGPFPPSVESCHYVISFNDVYSRFSICCMLRKKSDSEAALRASIS